MIFLSKCCDLTNIFFSSLCYNLHRRDTSIIKDRPKRNGLFLRKDSSIQL